MPDDCTSVSGGEETTTELMTTTMATSGGVDVEEMQQLDSSLLQSDAGDEGRLQIVVEDPATDDDQPLDEPGDVGQCQPAVDLMDDHVHAAACPSTPADQLETDVPAVTQVT